MAKRNLNQLRGALRIFRGKVALGRDERLSNLEFHFYFLAEGDDEGDEVEIAERDFDGDPASGHPMPGTYTVRATNTATGEVVLDESGVWQEKRLPPDVEKEKPAESMADTAKKLVNLAHGVADKSTMTLQRVQERYDLLEQKYQDLFKDREAQVEAIKLAKDETLQAKRERDQALVERDEAFAERDAIQEEYEAFQQRGGELAPVAERAVAAAVDRIAEVLEIQNPAIHRETFQECQEDLCQDLLLNRLPDLIALAQAEEIKWQTLRYLIFTYYHEDPGETPVDPDWKPKAAQEQQQEEAPPPQEEGPPQGETH